MASPPPTSALRSKSTLPVLFSVIILDLIGFGIVLPILPFYAEEHGASATVLGLLLAVHAAMQFIFSPIWGRLSDRIGRRPVMLVTIAGTSGALLMLGLADSIPALFAARILSGLFGANISVATAYVSDVTDESERTRWMGMVGASFGIGFLLGPAIGGLLAPYGHSVPMYVASGLAAINFVVASFILREPDRHRAPESARLSLRETLSDSLVARLCATNFLFTFGVAQLESVFAYLMMDRFDYDARQVAFVLVAMALVMAMIQGGGMRALAARYGEKTLLVSGLLIMGIAFPTIPYIGSVALLLIPLAGAAVGRAIAQPPMTSLVSMQADPNHRGAVLGAFQSSASLARIFGPVVAGLLYDAWIGGPFYLASALFIVSSAMTWRVVPEGAGRAAATS
jgi:multidrug resistance protein